MSRIIKIPLIDLETNVSNDASELEIIEAVSEATVIFCINASEDGEGIRDELKVIEDKKKFNRVKNELLTKLRDLTYEGDLSDIGNEIGIIIAKYTSSDFGWELNGFYDGIKHGISITDGTHGL